LRDQITIFASINFHKLLSLSTAQYPWANLHLVLFPFFIRALLSRRGTAARRALGAGGSAPRLGLLRAAEGKAIHERRRAEGTVAEAEFFGVNHARKDHGPDDVADGLASPHVLRRTDHAS